MADEKKSENTKKEKGASKNVAKIVDEVSKLSVLELSELVNELQDKLGVSAMPQAQAAPAESEKESQPAGGGTSGANQTLIMTSAGDQKIQVIKALREINQNWGLKEAKDMTDALPAEILKDAKAEEVKEAAEKLKSAGATVETK